MFQWSDAWLLLSLIYARDLVDRAYLRQVGDFINHAVFSDEELDGGMARLLRAGYATTKDGLFAPSPQVLDWYGAITKGKLRTFVWKDLERVEKFLGV